MIDPGAKLMSDLDGVKLAVTVKPLEWRDPYIGTKGYISVEARSVVSRYEVYCAGTGLRWAAEADNKPIGVFDTEAEAKAAAQADYTQRILSALSPTPGAPGTGGAWQCVPVEPTEAMIEAGDEARREHTATYFDGSEVADRDMPIHVYRAMLAATPAETQADEVGK